MRGTKPTVQSAVHGVSFETLKSGALAPGPLTEEMMGACGTYSFAELNFVIVLSTDRGHENLEMKIIRKCAGKTVS